MFRAIGVKRRTFSLGLVVRELDQALNETA